MGGTDSPGQPCPDLKQEMMTATSLLAYSPQLIYRNSHWLCDKIELLKTDYVIETHRDQNIQSEATHCETEAFQGKQVLSPNVYTFCSTEASVVRIV